MWKSWIYISNFIHQTFQDKGEKCEMNHFWKWRIKTENSIFFRLSSSVTDALTLKLCEFLKSNFPASSSSFSQHLPQNATFCKQYCKVLLPSFFCSIFNQQYLAKVVWGLDFKLETVQKSETALIWPLQLLMTGRQISPSSLSFQRYGVLAFWHFSDFFNGTETGKTTRSFCFRDITNCDEQQRSNWGFK